MRDADFAALSADCQLAAKFWKLTRSALMAMTCREKGEEATKRLGVMMLGQHQKEFYLEGLRKLGIRDDEPPAIRAAKYHYLANVIDGVTLEYIEESPRKVWLRSPAPMWYYPGVSLFALPSSISHATATAWYPRNGALMGCPRLGWVSTKLLPDMEACGEGYFIEYEHDLGLGEEYRFEPVTHTPEFDPSKAPRLDSRVWPEARILKARRNIAREYVRTIIDTMLQLFGQQTTYFLVRQVMRGMAIQFTHELKQEMGIEGSDAKAVADFLCGLQRAFGQDMQLTESQGLCRIVLGSQRPFGIDTGEELRDASFEFPVMAARLINGRISVTRVPNGEGEVWEICDAGRWLW